jgi:hydroxymethylpyrimidine pyrophosphatase-like HAD family hydrolase
MPDGIPFLDQVPDATERLAKARILYTDLDGTLLGAGGSLLRDGQGTTTLDGADAVAAVNTAGLPVVITSGRNVKQLTEVSRLLGWRDFIAEVGGIRGYDNGARRVCDLGTWPADALQADETPYMAIERMGAVALLRARYPGLVEYHDPWHRDREVTHILRGKLPILEAQALVDALPLPVTIIDNGIIRPRLHGLRGVDQIHAIHLVPTGVSKQGAIAADLADRGFTRDQALAIGDGAADIGMAEAVGLMVCVRNGLDDPTLLAAAERHANVAATHGERGNGWGELVRAWTAALRAS